MLKVLIACEYSGIVRDAFTAAGCFAVSCDLLPTESTGLHYQGDIFNLMPFPWDLMIGHPPCTYLSKVQQWMVNNSPAREQKQISAANFFIQLFNSNIHFIALENPSGALSRLFRPPDQIVRPGFFGDCHNKDICLWLKNLPPLVSTCYNNSKKSVSNHVNGQMSQAQKSKIRSKFFPLVAAAMAHQWVSFINNEIALNKYRIK